MEPVKNKPKMSYPSEFDGWPNYPIELGFSPLMADAEASNELLKQRANRLFGEDGESSLGLLEFGPLSRDGTREVEFASVESPEQLSEALRRPYASWVFFIAQSYTWSRLQISEQLFRKLVTRLRVHPAFLDVVHLFSEKVGPVEESFNHFFANFSVQPSLQSPLGSEQGSYELGYNVKYVARHGRTFPKDPFSIRETGVYHKFDSGNQESTWILMQASDSMKERLRRAYEKSNDTVPMNQFLVHASILHGVSEHWRDYLVYLEDTFSKLVDRGFYTNVKGPQVEGDIEADFSDIRKLQILTDKLRKLVQILQLNIDLAVQLQKVFLRIRVISNPELSAVFDEFDCRMDQFVFQQQTANNRIKGLIARADGISSLIQNILEIRAAENSKQMNSEMQKLTEQGIKENKLMKTLTHQSAQDTRSMMVVALISAIFLPATFLATLFGSNFFVYAQDKNSLVVASNFWIYIVVAVTFSGGTVLLWVWWWRGRLRARREAEADPEKRSLTV